MNPRIAFLLLACVSLFVSVARAVEPDEMLPDPAQEARARALTKDLRCVVCQNQSVDDSDAPLAKDIRVLVREKISQGQSDQQVTDFIVARYGKFVLLNPPLEGDTALLWIGPFAVFFIGLGMAALFIRRPGSAASPAQPLSETEERDLAAKLKEPTP
jgi:cytochrome c-type biogenesis protein CcmH